MVSSPAHDYAGEPIDLAHILIRDPVSTVIVRASGEFVEAVGIYPDDLLIIDRGLPPSNNNLVVIAVAGKLLTRRWMVDTEGTISLAALDADGESIPIEALPDGKIWGVVTCIIRPTHLCVRNAIRRTGPRTSAALHPRLGYT